ncbi:hypothetical protein N7478_009501 [Penicillium angulare]|uniref:uncharacterized protein n=1 Tax=Penicillium angulare TaxID=116970 RepID=UPI0025423F98|nr:uncharacterized protein N7478_009501 [Penicillium angulare]KAJ5266693.1 hypothetical protein N7478_009501 [Penicillium angulare]
MPLFYQQVLGFSPLKSAILTLPYVLAQSIAGAISGPLMSRCARFAKTIFQLMFPTDDKQIHTGATNGALSVVLWSRATPAVSQAYSYHRLRSSLVAVQALAKTKDRAVATSTRNLLRSLGSVFGIAISTATQQAVMQSALYNGTSSKPSEGYSVNGITASPNVLDAKMAGFRIVFITLVPLICLCFFANFLVTDVVLTGDR